MASLTKATAVPPIKDDTPSVGTGSSGPSTREDLVNLSRAIHVASLAYWERRKHLGNK